MCSLKYIVPLTEQPHLPKDSWQWTRSPPRQPTSPQLIFKIPVPHLKPPHVTVMSLLTSLSMTTGPSSETTKHTTRVIRTPTQPSTKHQIAPEPPEMTCFTTSCTFLLSRWCHIIAYCPQHPAARCLQSEDRLYAAVWDPAMMNKMMMGPSTNFFILKFFSVSFTVSCFISTIHHLMTSFWHRTRKTCLCYACWGSTHPHLSCPETWLGSRPTFCWLETWVEPFGHWDGHPPRF